MNYLNQIRKDLGLEINEHFHVLGIPEITSRDFWFTEDKFLCDDRDINTNAVLGAMLSKDISITKPIWSPKRGEIVYSSYRERPYACIESFPFDNKDILHMSLYAAGLIYPTEEIAKNNVSNDLTKYEKYLKNLENQHFNQNEIFPIDGFETMRDIPSLFGLCPNQQFKIDGKPGNFWFTGCRLKSDYDASNADSEDILGRLLTGEYKVIKPKWKPCSGQWVYSAFKYYPAGTVNSFTFCETNLQDITLYNEGVVYLTKQQALDHLEEDMNNYWKPILEKGGVQV